MRVERLPGVPPVAPVEPLLQGRFRRGHTIMLPGQGTTPLWATLDIRTTLLGSVAKRFRLLSDLARAGFLISPVVRNTADFVSLVLPERTHGAWPVSIEVVGGAGSNLSWRNEFELTIRSLPIPVQAGASALLAVAPTPNQ